MTTTTGTKPALPKCEPSDVVALLVPPSEVTDEDLMLVGGTLGNVLEVPAADSADGAYARFVVEHETFPSGRGDVYVRWDGLVAVRRYVTGEAAKGDSLAAALETKLADGSDFEVVCPDCCGLMLLSVRDVAEAVRARL